LQENERQKKPLFGKLAQNGSNKVAIELQVMLFWSEIILGNSNRMSAQREFDFEITHMISDQEVSL